ncbi:pentatricopeptide repeat-containing protein mitochondrial [Dorcoceras hygrometricum]|uniref:Pentatricopeptide repeat-containing protein mitochondrial n=1 Tax=Dorcoceras hygrometricum TaxID=472368 RepID=A0A2Z7AVC7_9LAMI|nr:pentatricopeptide repeat-containing protein mitochondrial [Dorcoceras hygrometricum]
MIPSASRTHSTTTIHMKQIKFNDQTQVIPRPRPNMYANRPPSKRSGKSQLTISSRRSVVELERKAAATQTQQRRKFSRDANSAEATSSSPRSFRIQVPRRETRFLNRELHPRNSEGTLTRTSQISRCNGQIEEIKGQLKLVTPWFNPTRVTVGVMVIKTEV